jgi:hypothetical protein
MEKRAHVHNGNCSTAKQRTKERHVLCWPCGSMVLRNSSTGGYSFRTRSAHERHDCLMYRVCPWSSVQMGKKKYEHILIRQRWAVCGETRGALSEHGADGAIAEAVTLPVAGARISDKSPCTPNGLHDMVPLGTLVTCIQHISSEGTSRARSEMLDISFAYSSVHTMIFYGYKAYCGMR